MTEERQPTGDLQRRFWNEWNLTAREQAPLDEPSLARADFVVSAIRDCVSPSARLLDLGCGTGWLSERMSAYVSNITAVDLADEVIVRARQRAPHIRFLSGDAMKVPDDRDYDAVVCVETFSHVPDQAEFVKRLSSLLRPGGTLILTTQNRIVFSHSKVMPQGKGQVRHWVTPMELAHFLRPCFRDVHMTTILPSASRGWLRFLSGRKACKVWDRLFGAARWRAMREWAGLGQTIAVIATKRWQDLVR